MTLLVSGIMAISHLYLGWRLTRAAVFVSGKTIIRWLPVLLLISFYLLPLTGLILYGINGRLDLFELPKAITYWFWFGFAFSFQLLGWVLVADVIKVGSSLLGGWNPAGINRWFGNAVLGLALVIGMYSGIKMYVDTNNIETEVIEQQIPGLPQQLDGFRIVHISDIQGDRYTGREKIAAYIDRLNEQDADLVIFTGDLISYGTDYITMAAEELGRAKATHGTYAVVGDHDFWAGLQYVEPAMEKRGVTLLRDENATIPVGSDTLLLTGITQVYSKRAVASEVDSLTSATSENALKVMASHQVSDMLVSNAEEKGYDMMLAGHTHGGQLRVPLLWMKFSASDRETEYVSGLYPMDGFFIHVNNGLGFTLAPVRYNAKPAVTVIELVSGNGR